jgi:hypothetical protein
VAVRTKKASGDFVTPGRAAGQSLLWTFIMDPTEQERKLAEGAARRYRRFLYRRSALLACLGAALRVLAVSLSRGTFGPKWCVELLKAASIFFLVFGFAGYFMEVIGKLYVRVKELEQQLKANSEDATPKTE